MKIRWSKARPGERLADLRPAGDDGDLLLGEGPANIRAISAEVAGVYSDGLIIARLPAASTPASGVKVRFTGKFHGLITPTTPLGW